MLFLIQSKKADWILILRNLHNTAPPWAGTFDWASFWPNQNISPFAILVAFVVKKPPLLFLGSPTWFSNGPSGLQKRNIIISPLIIRYEPGYCDEWKSFIFRKRIVGNRIFLTSRFPFLRIPSLRRPGRASRSKKGACDGDRHFSHQYEGYSFCAL